MRISPSTSRVNTSRAIYFTVYTYIWNILCQFRTINNLFPFRERKFLFSRVVCVAVYLKKEIYKKNISTLNLHRKHRIHRKSCIVFSFITMCIRRLAHVYGASYVSHIKLYSDVPEMSFDVKRLIKYIVFRRTST